MKTKDSNIFMQYKSIIRVALGTGLILLLPLSAMLISDEAAWSLSDFILAGTLLFGIGLTYEFVVRRGGNRVYRAAVAVGLAALLFLFMANLAVGVIGSEDEPANLMYFGVLLVGIVGSIIARFRPRGMVRAMLATALAQVLVTGIALIAGMYNYPGSSVFEILMVNGFFVALFGLSAFLFQRAEPVNNQQGTINN